MMSKCANPDCQQPFDYRKGEFFRFHKEGYSGGAAANLHSVQHFWLCDDCRARFTLEYRKDHGVLLRLESQPAHRRLIAAA